MARRTFTIRLDNTERARLNVAAELVGIPATTLARRATVAAAGWIAAAAREAADVAGVGEDATVMAQAEGTTHADSGS